jgi:hypothetical protein
MSRYVAKLFFYGTVITTHSRTRTSGTPANRIQSVVSIVSPILSFSPCYSLTSTFLIDSPELGPGAVLGPSGVSSSSASPTISPTPSPPVNGNSNTGAIVGGVVGGVAAISIAVALIFFYLRRRRSRAPAAAPGAGASQPPIDEIKQPLTEGGTNTGSSLPGTPGAPMRLYVRVFIPNPPPRSFVCSSHAFLPVFFWYAGPE